MAELSYCASAFGITWRADLPLTEFTQAGPGAAAPLLGSVAVRRVDMLAPRSPLRAVNAGWVYRDGIRLRWHEEAVFDMFDGRRIDYLPGPDWPGEFPPSFYSTVAALSAAWLGGVPLHACGIELDGRAFLIAGPSGAGKSSLAGALLEMGAKLVSDDLTVVRFNPRNGVIHVFRGRPAMRQHPRSAALLASDHCAPISGDPRGKWAVRPVARTSLDCLPLGGILVLQCSGEEVAAADKIARLGSHLFRPRWVAALPNKASLRRDLLAISARVPIVEFAPIGSFDIAAQAMRAEQALELFRKMGS